MANSNNPIPDDLFSDMERFQSYMESLNRAYGTQGAAMTDAERATRAATDANKKLVTGIANLGNSLTRFTAATSSQEGAYKAMGDATAMVTKGIGKLAGKLPIIGGFLEGLGEAAGEAIKVMTEATGKAFATFGKLSQTGIVSSFQDMRDAAEKTGLMFDEIDSVLSSHSESLAAFGGNASAGAKSLQEILKANKSLAAQSVKLGYSFGEFSEFEAAYIAMQTRAGLTRGKSDKELANSAAAYAYELDTLSKLTGKSRAEIQKEQEALQNNARVRAAMIDMPEKIQKELSRAIEMLPKEAHEGIADLVVNLGAPLSEAGRQLTREATAAGVDINGFAKQLGEGKISSVEFVSKLRGGAKNIVVATKDITKVLGADSPVSKNYVMWADMAQQSTDVQAEYNKIIEARKKQLEDGDPAADAQNMAREVALKSQNILTSTQTIMAANAAVGKGMLALADTIDTVIKKLGGSPVNTGTKKVIEGTKNLIPADSFSSKSVPVPPVAATPTTGSLTRGLSSSTKNLNNNQFANNLYDAIYQAAKAQGLQNPDVIARLGATQSALETGWGKSLAGGNNYFGIKGGNGSAQKTKEFVNGQWITINDKFRQYGSMQESATDWVKFLATNPRYKGVLGATNIEDAIRLQGQSGYATDPNYSKNLASVYNSLGGKIDETRMASLTSPPPAAVQTVAQNLPVSFSPFSSGQTNTEILLKSANSKLDDVVSALNRIYRTNKDMAHAMS